MSLFFSINYYYRGDFCRDFLVSTFGSNARTYLGCETGYLISTLGSNAGTYFGCETGYLICS